MFNSTENAHLGGQVWWIMAVIPATWEAELGRTAFGGKLRHKVSKTLSQSISWCGGLHLKFQLQGKHR
jgi:hypothetical protein